MRSVLYFDLGIDTFMTYLIGYSLGECKTIFAIPRTYRVQIYTMPNFCVNSHVGIKCL